MIWLDVAGFDLPFSLVLPILWLALKVKLSCLIGSDPEHIFLTDGASKGVMQILNTIIRGEGDGVNSFSFDVASFCFFCFPFNFDGLS